MNLFVKQIQLQKIEAFANSFNYMITALKTNNRYKLDEKYFTIRNAKAVAMKTYKDKFFLIYGS